MSVPNFITIARFLLLPIFVILMLERKFNLALVVFLFAGFTDVLDGYIARKYNMVTRCGKILDPLADKLIQLTALVMITITGVVSNIMPLLVIILGKELLMGIGSMLLWRKGIIVSANWYGKVATIIFYAAIVFSILMPNYGKMFLIVAVIAAIFAFGMYFINYLKLRQSI